MHSPPTYLLLCQGQGQGSAYSSSEEQIGVRFKLGSVCVSF